MRIGRKNVKKLASLTALGAGALALGVPKADAGPITYSGPVNAQVGFDNGFGASYLSPTLGSSGAKFGFNTFFNSTFQGTSPVFKSTHGVNGYRGGGSASFAVLPAGLQVFSAGATWNNRNGSAASALVAERRNGVMRVGTGPSGTPGETFIPFTAASGLSSFNDKYALLKFKSGAGFDYGWVLLSLSVTPTSGPDLTIESYAYDTTNGELIAAGQTTSATPEPDAFALTGLGALALGAAGLRRWRTARKAA